jgi:hypothetical protein
VSVLSLKMDGKAVDEDTNAEHANIDFNTKREGKE